MIESNQHIIIRDLKWKSKMEGLYAKQNKMYFRCVVFSDYNSL